MGIKKTIKALVYSKALTYLIPSSAQTNYLIWVSNLAESLPKVIAYE
jgi:hypothetical protein